MNKKKYVVEYCSGASGYGDEYEVDTIEEVISLIKDSKDDYSAFVRVYDRKLGESIFWKDPLTYKFYIDLIFTNRKRDLRTKDRMKKA